MTMFAAPRRVADTIFRKDMVGPSFGNIAASMTGLLLVEKVALEILFPAWVPVLEAYILRYGLFAVLAVGGGVLLTVAFWGVGTLLALPAILGVQRWKIQAGRSIDHRQLLQSLPLISLNFFMSVALLPFGFYYFLPAASFDLRNTPSTGRLLRDVVGWIAAEEILFFYIHRWMHENKYLYARIHKLHHTWTTPVSFSAFYVHPLEQIVSSAGPLVAGPILCGSHIAAAAVWTFIGVAHTLAVHSGYWIVDDDGMHDEHHAKFTVNYGVIGVLDMWHGSYRLPAAASETSMGKPGKPGKPSGKDS